MDRYPEMCISKYHPENILYVLLGRNELHNVSMKSLRTRYEIEYEKINALEFGTYASYAQDQLFEVQAKSRFDQMELTY